MVSFWFDVLKYVSVFENSMVKVKIPGQVT